MALEPLFEVLIDDFGDEKVFRHLQVISLDGQKVKFPLLVHHFQPQPILKFFKWSYHRRICRKINSERYYTSV